MIEAYVLRPVRTEYGKAIRKKYESGEIKESRHNMTRLEPRLDGISNTLTTVLKDNYVMIIEELVDIPKADVIEREKIDKAIDEIQKLRGCSCSCSDGIIDDVENILDKLIESGEDNGST